MTEEKCKDFNKKITDRTVKIENIANAAELGFRIEDGLSGWEVKNWPLDYNNWVPSGCFSVTENNGSVGPTYFNRQTGGSQYPIADFQMWKKDDNALEHLWKKDVERYQVACLCEENYLFLVEAAPNASCPPNYRKMTAPECDDARYAIKEKLPEAEMHRIRNGHEPLHVASYGDSYTPPGCFIEKQNWSGSLLILYNKAPGEVMSEQAGSAHTDYSYTMVCTKEVPSTAPIFT